VPAKVSLDRTCMQIAFQVERSWGLKGTVRVEALRRVFCRTMLCMDDVELLRSRPAAPVQRHAARLQVEVYRHDVSRWDGMVGVADIAKVC
jgi:hypothetical protein